MSMDYSNINPTPNHSGYFADKAGNIYSNKRGSLKKLAVNNDHRGYLICGIRRNDGTKRAAKVHHLVLEAFVGPKPSDLHVARHLNDDSTDNRLDNLAWGTLEENKMDKKHNLGKKFAKIVNKNKTCHVKKYILSKILQAGICSLEELSLVSGWNVKILSGVIAQPATHGTAGGCPPADGPDRSLPAPLSSG